MGNANKYSRCNFCENDSSIPGAACVDKDNNKVLCCGWDHFYLDGDKVAKEAKRLGIGITDVLAMIEAANKLRGNNKKSSDETASYEYESLLYGVIL